MRGSRSGMTPIRPRRRRGKSCASTRCMPLKRAGTRPPAIAELVSTAVLRRHLETMLRLGIEYDLLPRESEILHLHFWDLAFEQLKAKGVLYFENRGQEQGLLGDAPALGQPRSLRAKVQTRMPR